MPLAIAVVLLWLPVLTITFRGLLWATLSGSITSGVGYVLWYTALPRLTATRAATVQLTVPVLAAIGGVTVLSEAVSLRLVISAVVILGGVGPGGLLPQIETRAARAFSRRRTDLCQRLRIQ